MLSPQLRNAIYTILSFRLLYYLTSKTGFFIIVEGPQVCFLGGKNRENIRRIFRNNK